MISLITAIGKNNEIGKGNTLLWHMPNDLKHFKEITSGKTVIMGRKTFESIGRPLPNRRNIVISRDTNYQIENVEIYNSLDEALEKANLGVELPSEEIFIIGGAEIYKQAIEKADKLYITHINNEDKEADTFFPIIDKDVWQEISRENHYKDEKHNYNYAFIEYIRK